MSYEQKDTKQDRYMLIHHKIDTSIWNDGRDLGCFNITFVYLDDETGKPRNFSNNKYDAEIQGDFMSGLTVKAQYNIPEHNYWEAYGWSIEYYDEMFVDLDKAEAMVKSHGRNQ